MKRIKTILRKLDDIQGKRWTSVELDLRLDLERAVREHIEDLEALSDIKPAAESYRGQHDYSYNNS